MKSPGVTVIDAKTARRHACTPAELCGSGTAREVMHVYAGSLGFSRTVVD